MFDRKPPEFAAIPAGLDALQQEINALVLPE
jgi:hypothetical protein